MLPTHEIHSISKATSIPRPHGSHVARQAFYIDLVMEAFRLAVGICDKAKVLQERRAVLIAFASWREHYLSTPAYDPLVLPPPTIALPPRYSQHCPHSTVCDRPAAVEVSRAVATPNRKQHQSARDRLVRQRREVSIEVQEL